MADEGAFMELIIANERVGEWLDALSNTSFVSLRRRRAADALAKAVQESEAYQEEAVQSDAAGAIALALEAPDTAADPKLAASLQACLRALTTGQEASLKMREYTFGGHVLVIKESALGEGVGSKVWGAASIFNHKLLELAPTLVHAREVLEVGAGCGLCGLLAARLGAARVVMADCFAGVLRNLQQCVQLNRAATPASCLMETRYQDWAEESQIEVPGGVPPSKDVAGVQASDLPPRLVSDEKFSTVIASDILYEPQHATQLGDCLARRLAPRGVCLMLLPIRDADLMTRFRSGAHSHGLQTCVETLDAAQWDRQGLRGSCDYEGGYNWVYLQWKDAPAAPEMGVSELPWI
mmetsp:Transcript_28490/g.54358  ORF Transcript_28490/g.54358 Transcript_28490/m.54358 type:complete len:352 (-) Transcript_28490:316-1371(-)